MQRAKEKRTARRQQNTKLINEAKTALGTTDIGMLCALIERLRANNDDLLKLNTELEDSIADEDFASEFEAVMRYGDAARGMLGQLKSREAELVRAPRLLTTETTVLQRERQHGGGEATTATHRSAVKLPTLQLQTFNGEIRQWRCFWEQFKEAVDDNGNLTKGEKFHYLRSLLSGAAASSIAGLQATGECYDDAVSILSKRFGDTRQIVQEHLAQLRSLPPVTSSDDVRSLRKLVDHIQCHVRGPNGLKVSSTTYSTMIIDILLKALPADIVVGYYKQLASKPDSSRSASDAQNGEATTSVTGPADGEMEHLLNYLTVEVESREKSGIGISRDIKRGRPESQRKELSLPPTSAVLHATSHVREQCLFCGSLTHSTAECNSEVGREERLQKLKGDNRCFRCTLKGHRSKDCRRRLKCRKCGGRHTLSVCDPNWKPNSGEATPRLEANSLHVSSRSSMNSEILLQTCRLWAVGEGRCGYIRGIVDGGSHRTFIREDISKFLGLKEIEKTSLQLSTFGTAISASQKRRLVQVRLRSQYDDKEYIIEAIEVPFICNDIVQVPVENDFFKEIEQTGRPIADKLLLPGMPAVPGIGLLIGADHLWKFMTGEIQRYAQNNDLVALGSVFGWMFQGPMSVHTTFDTLSNLCVLRVSTVLESTERLVKGFWDLESIGITDHNGGPNEEAEAILDQFERNISKQNARYEVALPWKENSGHLSDNRSQALKRLKSLGKRMQRNPEFGTEYDSTMRNYLDMGYAERVTPDERTTHQAYYMPHHAVFRSDSSTTRLRIVFDASSHEQGSASLNEHLEKGPCLIADLVKLLIRFRIHQIALTADIEKAFLQISVREEDRDFLRFLWFKGLSSNNRLDPEVEEWRMTRVPFGTKASPFLLNATLQHHLKTVADRQQKTAALLAESFYVDDLLVGADTEENAEEIFEQATDILAACGMSLRKWSSSSKHLQDLFVSQEGVKNSSGSVKILGLVWNPESDTITVATKSLSGVLGTQNNCKRLVLQTIARIFDPIGLLAPFTIQAKILFQELWQRHVDWDEELPDDIAQKWEAWKAELIHISSLTVPRCVAPVVQPQSVQLHIFCDASQRAYGTCAYLRLEDAHGCVHTTLIFVKARVSPLKGMTLPRLELMGALLGARIGKFLTGCLMSYAGRWQIIYWTDSSITLHWLKGNPLQWNQFVRNRVNEIQSCTEKDEWRHCPGLQNPADRVTRGVTLHSLKKDRSWWFGPSWLAGREDTWPALKERYVPTAAESSEERNEVKVLQVRTFMPILDLAHHSSFLRVLRITAWVLRFINACRSPSRQVSTSLTADDVERAESYWIKSVQEEEYKDDVSRLVQGVSINPQSSLRKLQPILDTEGLLRVGGRLHFSEETEEVKHPILLPPGHPFTELVIRDAHLRTLHGGSRDTLTEVRERFWIPRGLQQVKRVLTKCNVCLKARAKPGEAPTAPLPAERVCRSEPFQVVGIDFAGPLFTNDKDTVSKAYIALFTCAVTRAVHLELVSNLSSEMFLLAFRRFTSRRGLPSVVYSDNAKTFQRASKEMAALKEPLFDGGFQDHCAKARIRWKFIVERAAWWGGFSERMVRTVKVCLRKVLRQARLTFEQLTTVLQEVESIANSRPLTQISSSPEEPEVLTPAHFLTGRRLTALPSQSRDVSSSTQAVTRRWMHHKRLLEQFWRRWRKEYLLILRSAHTCDKQAAQKISVGDLVLIHDEKAPRQMWKMRRIIEVIPGRDHHIRACVVQLPNGSTLRRPVQLLYPLELCA